MIPIACTLGFDDEYMLAIYIRALAYFWRFIMQDRGDGFNWEDALDFSVERALDVHEEVLPWLAN